jgi:hypothetical protein
MESRRVLDSVGQGDDAPQAVSNQKKPSRGMALTDVLEEDLEVLQITGI